MDIEDQKCENCKYWKKKTTNYGVTPNYGDCRRYPPKNITPAIVKEMEFPEVRDDCWCGEHKAK